MNYTLNQQFYLILRKHEEKLLCQEFAIVSYTLERSAEIAKLILAMSVCEGCRMMGWKIGGLRVEFADVPPFTARSR